MSCALANWKLDAAKIDPAKAKYLVGYDPAEAKKLLAEAGYAKGFNMLGDALRDLLDPRLKGG